jgi:formamidopyrimidine-DNA glycosylase
LDFFFAGEISNARHNPAMPELPEVETVRAGLARLLKKNATHAIISRIELTRGDIRKPIPTTVVTQLTGQTILGLRRRAKYILFDTAQGSLLCHLGMTGSWRLAPPGDEREHDHCYLHLSDGRRLAFRDPRRFGLLDFVAPGQDTTHPCLAHLGPEPLDEQMFHADYLLTACHKRKQAIKPLIMDQSIVVGVGNIYAQEALFLAGISPRRRAGRLRPTEAVELVKHIRHVLTAAIKAGGSTISDFRQAGGSSGYFQHQFNVYDRAGLPCTRCTTPLRAAVIGGRGTTWCPTCQR